MKNKVTSVMRFSAITNIFLALIKVIIGFICKSGALISDGIHSFSDLMTDFVAIIGGILARKPADKEHPYGHGMIEYFTSLIIGVVIIIVGIEVIYNSFNRDIIIPNVLVIVVSIITIIVKILLSNYIIKNGKKMNNNILIASGKESRMDVISSIVVLVAAIFMQLGNISKIFEYSDKVASSIVGVFIIIAGISILKENMSFTLGKQEMDYDYRHDIKRIVRAIDGVIDIKSLVIMKYGYRSSLSATIIMDGNIPLKEAHDTADIIEKEIKKYDDNIEYINLHVEPSNN